MHELSVCISLLEQIEKIAMEHQANTVTSITVSIGPLSGVEPELLSNAWPLASAGSIAHSATLLLETSKILVQCSVCGEKSEARPNRLVCSACGDYRTRLVSGDELILERLELGYPEAASA